MAKDVDLSSREWLDLIFEGKNKDFGAYEIRQESPKRHNKSVIYTIIGIAICALLAYGYTAVNKYLTEKRLEEERIKQEQLAAQAALEEEIEEEEEQQIEIPEEKEQILEEEVQASQKVTELNIVADELVKEPPKTVEQVIENKDVIGGKDQEGSDDITKDVVKVDQTVVKEVEPPKPKEEKVEVKPEPKPEKEEVFDELH